MLNPRFFSARKNDFRSGPIWNRDFWNELKRLKFVSGAQNHRGTRMVARRTVTRGFNRPQVVLQFAHRMFHHGWESTVTLGVRCPHCESQFQLSPDLLGKSMRCPNTDCREIFEVRGEQEPAIPGAVSVAPLTSGSVTDFLQVIEVEPSSAQIFNAEMLPVARSLPPLPPRPVVKLPAATLLPGPREVAWNAADEPIPKTTLFKKQIDDHVPVTRRKKRRGVPKAMLALVSLALVGTLITVGAMLLLREKRTEEKLVQDAEKLYGEGKFGESAKRYEELQKEYPDSENVKKYDFFSRLSATQNAIGAVAARENPTAPLQTLREFLGEYGESPFALPDTGFGTDIVQAGQKLAAVFNDNAGDRIKEFRKDRSKLPELDSAEKSVQQGRELLPQLERYRGGAGMSSDKARELFDATSGEIFKERTRLAVLAPFQDLAVEPTDERIAEFEQTIKKAGLEKDEEAKTLAVQARTNLRVLVKFVLERRLAVAAPMDPPLAFVAPAIAGSPDPKAGTEATNDTIFGLAHGVCYAIDAHTGNLLWGRKLHATSADSRTVDLPLRVVLADGAIDWVLLPSSADGQSAITARRTRTGEAIWHQTLPHPCLGQPVIIGKQLFVPLQDALGTVVHLDVVTGEQYGSLALRQPIGGGLAVLPGLHADHGFLVVPGDARRVFVIEWGRVDADNRKEPLTCVRSFATQHAKDSLRVEPMLTSSGEAGSPARLTLCEGDGPGAMKLRSFPLPAIEQLSKLQSEGDTPIDAVAETRVNGWNSFAPLSDGERVCVSTDAGVFLALGVNQVGNADAGLFTLPGQPPAKEQEQVCRSQVIAQDEEAVWVLLGHRLIRLKVAIDGLGGYRLMPRGEAKLLGEPLARSQVRPALNRAFVTYRPSVGGAVRMMAFDLETGLTVWERQLGAVAIHAPIPLANKEYLLVDGFAGVYRVRNSSAPDQEPALQTETVTPPTEAADGPARVVVSADGHDVWTLLLATPADGTKLKLQKFTDGKSVGVTALPLLDQLAGVPLAFGAQLLVPLANGYVYRVDIADTALKTGSVWRGSTIRGPTSCHLSGAGVGSYLASDGNVEVSLYSWPADKDEAARLAGPWDARGKIGLPAVWIEVGDTKFVATGTDGGTVCLFDRTKALLDPIRTWKGNPKGPIPEGAVTQQFLLLERAEGTRLVYSVKKESLVCLNLSEDKPEWVVRSPSPNSGELLGWIRDGDRLLVSYQSGSVQVLNPKTGIAVEETESDRPTSEVAAIRYGADQLLQAHSDGTVGLTPIAATGMK